MKSIFFSPKQIYDFIKKHEPFSQLSNACLLKVASALETEAHQGDSLLIKKGAILGDLYILIKGRLYYKVTDNDGNTTFHGEFNEGAIIGEMALISDLARSADVYTMRDSIILKLSKENFLQLSHTYPELLSKITQFTIKRLTKSLQGTRPTTTRNKSIALIPIRPMPDLENQLQEMIRKFPYGEKILLLTSDCILGKKHCLNENGNLNQDGILWVNQQEEHYSFIFYLADPTVTPWSKFCIRQADSLAFLAPAEASDFSCSEVEQYINDENKNFFIKRKILVLLHNSTASPKNSQSWLQNRKINNHFHVRANTKTGIARMMRIFTDNTVSLVLSGSGARSLAYIGVYKRLEELKIPIDYIAGTSMGAMLAAIFAMGHTAQEVLSMVNSYLIKGSKIDLMFPDISSASETKVNRALINIYGEHNQIEDLWLNYFCVSTDLISQNVYVHDRGLLWESIRSSISLPFIYPPVSLDDKLLLDRSMLNNIPIDIIRQYSRSSEIIVANIENNTLFKLNPPPYSLSGWKLLYNKFMGKESILPLNLGELVQHVLTTSSHPNTEKMTGMADNCLSLNMDKFAMLDFKRFNKIIDEGYKQAKEQLNTQNIKALLLPSDETQNKFEYVPDSSKMRPLPAVVVHQRRH